MARKIVIKQRAAFWSSGMGMENAYTTNGDKTNRQALEPHSTVKGAFNKYTVRKGPDGRWLTGIDPEAAAFKRISDEKLKAQKIKEAQSNLDRLQRITGKDLSGLSDSWLNFAIKVVHQSGDTVFDLDFPDQELQFLAGVASHIFAPSEDDLKQEKYKDCRFYVYNGEEVVSKQKQNKLLRREIVSLLHNYKDNKERLYYIAKTCDIVATRTMTNEDIFNILADHAESAPPSLLEGFKDVVTRDPKDLQVNVKVKEAIERDIIRYNGTTKSFLFLGKQVGRTTDGVIQYFSETQNENLFSQVEEAIEAQY